MLKKFILNALSSFVGAWIAIILCVTGVTVLILGIIGSVASSEVAKVSRHSVLKINLSGTIIENETAPQLDYTLFLRGKIEQPQTLKNIVAAIEGAKSNGNIDAIYIECNDASASPATLNVIRESIRDFKKCGKRVFAYGDAMSMGDYYVASVADEVYLNPAGNLNLQGINGTVLYFKDLLDKVGIDIQTVRVGSFKSAVEPYTSNEMSAPARLQLDSLYSEMWAYIRDGIAKDRKVSAARIDSLVNGYLFLDEAIVAKKSGLVDNCLYYREVADIIANYVGKDSDDINFVGPELLTGNYFNNPDASNQIAVLYAVGDIAESEAAGIDCHKLVPIIVSLANNDNVKGLVLRVNSPGGSVFGSEQIGEALDFFMSKGKPLAVSMGDYAASGGYWISAGADRIFADPLTITGSIGIFGMVPNASGLAAKIGVHPQTVGTNPQVLFPSIFYPLTPGQHDALQKNVERGYDKFITRVADGRNKSPEYIRSIAEGRVWNAIKAQQLGLVDQLGTLRDAIGWVEGKVNESKTNVVYYPEVENSFLQMFASYTSAHSEEVNAVIQNLQKRHLDDYAVSFAQWVLLQYPLQARSPYYLLTL